MDELVRSILQFGFFYILFGFTFSLLFWLLIRPLVLWYFKIGKTENILIEIRDLLAEQKQIIPNMNYEIISPEISKPIKSKTLAESRWSQSD